jgi:hypothetical protein
VAFVEVRFVAEAKCCVPRLELLCALEKSDDIAVHCNAANDRFSLDSATFLRLVAGGLPLRADARA